mmetsp:Transcript_37201/g.89460  ORF Transcript_37201/g.89460 Transcript_37201/m.89460 type:complete len:298 (-) Transcript_37201:51-944(-)
MQDDGYVSDEPKAAKRRAIVPWGLVGPPLLAFVGISLLWVLVHHWIPIVVFIVYVALVFVSFAPYIVVTERSRSPTTWFLAWGLLTSLGGTFGMLSGSLAYNKYIRRYWGYEEHRHYHNVLASEPAGAHADAGVIVFTRGVHVDVTKSVGFSAGKVYCAAPIMDDTVVSQVEYWAVGKDCCSSRGEMWCDSVHNIHARTGAVVLEDTSLMSNLTSSGLDHSRFLSAVKQAAAAYELTVPEEPLMLRWISDLSAVQAQYWRDAAIYVGVTCFLYFLFAIPAAWAANEVARRLDKARRQ